MAAMAIDWISYIYASTIGGGGIITYAKSGCPVALVLGVVGGGLAGYSASKSSINPQNTQLMQGVSLIHGAIYAHRYYKTKQTIPSGFFAILSACVLARSAYMMKTGVEAAAVEIVKSS